MKKIRKGVFETNSSSTHSICIAVDTELNIPKSIHFEFGEFGWEYDTLYSVSEKASYLYTAIVNYKEEDLERFIKILENKNIEVTKEERSGKYFDTGYIDHGYELNKFVNDLLADEDRLMNYLFSDLSFIITGNDNDDEDVSINISYPHIEYYKGN